MIRYEPMTPETFTRAVGLAEAIFGTPGMHVAEFLESMGTAVTTVGVAREGDEVVGVCSVVPLNFVAQTRALANLAVEEDHRRQGVGTGLVQFMERHTLDSILPEGSAHMLVNALPASQTLFEKLGYQGSTPLASGSIIMSKRLR
jgi:GNAT superfamily N-acetyltransferase